MVAAKMRASAAMRLPPPPAAGSLRAATKQRRPRGLLGARSAAVAGRGSVRPASGAGAKVAGSARPRRAVATAVVPESISGAAALGVGFIVATPLLVLVLAVIQGGIPRSKTAARLLPGRKQSLASEDSDPKGREEEVAKRRLEYPVRKGVVYDFDGGQGNSKGKPVPYSTPNSANVQHVMPSVTFVDVAGPDGQSLGSGYVPEDQKYTITYQYKNVQALINLFVGRLGLVGAFDNAGKAIADAARTLISLLTKPLGIQADTFDSLDTYAGLYSRAVGPPKALEGGYWNNDTYFGTQRLSGVNPVMLKRVKSLQSSEIDSNKLRAASAAPGCDGASLKALAAKGDLYVVDYAKILKADTPVPHSYCTLSDADIYRTRRHLPTPFVLLEHGTDDEVFSVLRPLAIVIEGEAFWPTMGRGEEPHPAWQVAKQYVQAADGTVHEGRSHLGRTHLVIEPIAAAFARNMPPAHPLFQLMAVHTQMMVSKNRDAVYALAQPGGFVNELLGPPVMTETYAAVDEAVATWSINQVRTPRCVVAEEPLPYTVISFVHASRIASALTLSTTVGARVCAVRAVQ